MHTAARMWRNQASPVLAFLLGGSLMGCAGTAPPPSSPEPALPEGWQVQALPLPASLQAPLQASGAPDGALRALVRDARTPPLRYRVIVVPGSGCAGMGPVADRYFAGLLHAQVLVLHKPGVHPMDATPSGACPAGFVRRDALGAWQAAARAALLAHEATHPATLPTVLVGISEGGELLPGLAPAVQGLAGMVLMASSGLDPREAGALQAQRQGHAADWNALGALQANPAADDAVIAQGRSLRYWRDLWSWPLQQPLIRSPWPVLQAWGEADELVPPAAYERFAQQLSGALRTGERTAPWCTLRVPGANHGLQAAPAAPPDAAQPGAAQPNAARPDAARPDGVQRVWAVLEQWARTPQGGLCAPLQAR